MPHTPTSFTSVAVPSRHDGLSLTPVGLLSKSADQRPYKKRGVDLTSLGDQSDGTFLILISCVCDNSTTKESLDNYWHFRNYYWGENRIEQKIEAGKRFTTLDLTPADLPELNIRSIKTLIIREEYQIAYNAIVKAIKMAPEDITIYLLTGQPGTGL